MRVAIIHDWLETYAGAERVLEQLLLLYPQAELFSLVDFLPPDARGFLQGRTPTTSFIQKMPLARRFFRHYLGLFPLAIEQLDLRGFDVVLSSSHCVAKGVRTAPDQLHICYSHTPVRYAWDLMDEYLEQMSLKKGPKSWLIRKILFDLRHWDVSSSVGVDHFVANSAFTAKRIAKYYRREAGVIYPPVSVEDFTLGTEKEDFYCTASRQVPYKKIDVIVEAFLDMPDKKLKIIGDGPEHQKIAALAKNAPNIELMGKQPLAILRETMQKAKAFVFAAKEDFGITPIEAQACGTPVIGYGAGALLETIQPLVAHDPLKAINQAGEAIAPTGVFFYAQTPAAIITAIHNFEQNQAAFSPEACRHNALRFQPQHFREQIHGLVEKLR